MENDAQDPLAMVAAARASAADRLVTPWWYHPILGLLLAGLLLGISLADGPWVGLTVVLFAVGTVLLMQAYRRMTGVWVSGHEAGPASRWAGAMGAVAAVCLAGAMFAGRAGLDWLVWVLAAVVVVSTMVLGRRFDGALRAQLRAS